MNSYVGWVTACVAHYRCHRYVRRAVDSLLAQSYPWMRVVVVNDGDPCPPWRELASITDPRLLRFDLGRNGGCFFCWEVVRRATPDPFFMVQDADDWAAPQRAAALLRQLLKDRSDLAVSAQSHFYEGPNGTTYQVGTRWSRVISGETGARFVVQKKLTHRFRHRVPHIGLIRNSSLRNIGGYYGGFRVGWDVLLTNLVLMTGSISWTSSPLYYRLLRGDSLTHSAETGTQSEYATSVTRCLRQLYEDCYLKYKSYRRGELTRYQLADSIQQICGRYVRDEDHDALNVNARRLREMMR
jgi:hypothetical protein